MTPDPIEHLSLAYSIVSRFVALHPKCRHLRQDLEAAARLALCEAALRYRPERGNWSSFAGRLVSNEVVNEVRRLIPPTTSRRTKKLDVASSMDMMTEAELENLLGPSHREEIPELLAQANETSRLLDKLPSLEKRILHLRYGFSDGYDLRDEEIGRLVGLHRCTVHRKRSSAIGFLAEYASRTT